MATRKKLTKREKARAAERKRHRKLYRNRRGMRVFGKESVTRMIRVNVKFADLLKRKAKAAGLTIPQYTERRAGR